jgi:hypothetical protein
MKRTYLKLKEGDVFKINYENEIRYFQYFYTDMNYLKGNLVWVFNYKNPTTDLQLILESGYHFYLYTTIKSGIKLKLFEKIGNIPIPKNMQFIPEFRYTGDDLTKEIQNWYILKGKDETHIGKHLNDKQKKLPFASINFPWQAIEAMILGYDPFMKKTEFPYFP